MPQLMKDLIITAFDICGEPTYKYVIEPDLDDEGRVKLVPETDDWGKPIIDKRTGKPVLRQKMVRRRVREWGGVEGALGYLVYLAQLWVHYGGTDCLA
jgi:hypothetical protein